MPPASLRSVLLFTLALAACSTEQSWKRVAAQVSAGAIRAHAEFLSRDDWNGRRALSTQSALALGYVKAVLINFQLEPAVESTELRRTTVQEGHLVAALPGPTSVKLELEPERDFVLRMAPAKETLDLDLETVERPTLQKWLALSALHGRETLVEKAEQRLTVALSPRATLATKGAKLRLTVKLAHAPFRATRLLVDLPGRTNCRKERHVHVDGLGASFPGAVDSALPTAILLELVRVVVQSKDRPTCRLHFVFSTVGEWMARDHAPSWAPPSLAAKAHLPADRIDADWDWEALKRIAQGQLMELVRPIVP